MVYAEIIEHFADNYQDRFSAVPGSLSGNRVTSGGAAISDKLWGYGYRTDFPTLRSGISVKKGTPQWRAFLLD
jgi:hypothetical protein